MLLLLKEQQSYVGIFKIFKTVTVFTLELEQIPKDKIDNFFKELFEIKNIKLVRIPLKSIGYEDPKNANIFSKIYSSLITRLICSNGFWYNNLKNKVKTMFQRIH